MHPAATDPLIGVIGAPKMAPNDQFLLGHSAGFFPQGHVAIQ
jgi:hypothetical protein